MLFMDRPLLPFQPCSQGNPPFLPTVATLPGFETQVGNVASAIVNRLNDIAMVSKLTLATYNAMCHMGWNNDLYIETVQIGCWLLATGVKQGVYRNTQSGLVDCAQNAVRLATGIMLRRHPELEQFLSPAERKQVEAVKLRLRETTVEMQRVLSSLDTVTTTQPVFSLKSHTPNPEPKASTMNISYRITFENNRYVVSLSSGQKIYMDDVAHLFPQCPINQDFWLTQEQLMGLQQMFPALFAPQPVQAAPVMMQPALMPMVMQGGHPQQRHGMSVAGMGMRVGQPTAAPQAVLGGATTADTSRYGAPPAMRTTERPMEQMQAPEPAPAPKAVNSAADAYLEKWNRTKFALRDGSKDEVLDIRVGEARRTLYQNAYSDAVTAIGELTRTGLPAPQLSLSLDLALRLNSSVGRDADCFSYDVVNVVSGYILPAEDDPDSSIEDGEDQETKKKTDSLALGIRSVFRDPQGRTPTQILNGILRGQTGDRADERRDSFLRWLDARLTERVGQLLRDRYELEVDFDAASEDLPDLMKLLDDMGADSTQFRDDLENVYMAFLTPNVKDYDDVVTRYCKEMGVPPANVDVGLMSVPYGVTYLPLFYSQLNWNLRSTARRVMEPDEHPLMRRLTTLFDWAEANTEEPGLTHHYVVTRDDVVFRFVRSDKSNDRGQRKVWLVTKVNK